MTFKAYLDNIKAKTGKSPDDFQKLAKKKGLTSYSDLLKWLKNECGLGHGHANAIILYIQKPELAKQKLAQEEKSKKGGR